MRQHNTGAVSGCLVRDGKTPRCCASPENVGGGGGGGQTLTHFFPTCKSCGKLTINGIGVLLSSMYMTDFRADKQKEEGEKREKS